MLEEDGRVVGYGDIWLQDDELALDVAAPGRWAPFFDWAEAGARERGSPRVRVIPPAGPRAGGDRGGAWLPALAVVVHDGDRSRLEAARGGAARRASTLRTYAPGDERGAERAAERRVRRRPVLARRHAVELPRVLSPGARLRSDAVAARVGRRRARRLGARPIRSTAATRRSAGSGRSASGALAAAWARRRAAPPGVPRAVRPRLDGGSGSASTPRTRPARSASTNAPACERSARSTTGCSTCERASRALPRLSHTHRGRDRPGVPVPQLRARVRSRAGARAEGVGRRRRGDGRGGAHGAAVAGGGRRRRGDARRSRSTRLARELPARPLVLGGCCCSHVGAVRELARRHGRIAVVWLDAHGDLNTPAVVAVRQRVGHAAADADRRRRRRAGRRDAARCPQPRSARGGVHRRGRHPARELGDAARARLRRTRRRRRRARRARRVHAGAGRPRRSTGSRRFSPPCHGPRARDCPGSGPPPGTSMRARAARATRSGCNPDAAGRGLSSTHGRGPDRRPGRAQARSAPVREEAPEYVSQVRVALPRRRARGVALGVHALRPPLPDRRACADRLVRGRGHVRRGGEPTFAPTTRSSSSTCGRTPSGSRRPS